MQVRAGTPSLTRMRQLPCTAQALHPGRQRREGRPGALCRSPTARERQLTFRHAAAPAHEQQHRAAARAPGSIAHSPQPQWLRPVHPSHGPPPAPRMPAVQGPPVQPLPSAARGRWRKKVRALRGAVPRTMRMRSSNSFCCLADRPPGIPPPPLDAPPSTAAMNGWDKLFVWDKTYS
jgi:hypothetical protein